MRISTYVKHQISNGFRRKQEKYHLLNDNSIELSMSNVDIQSRQTHSLLCLSTKINHIYWTTLESFSEYLDLCWLVWVVFASNLLFISYLWFKSCLVFLSSVFVIPLLTLGSLLGIWFNFSTDFYCSQLHIQLAINSCFFSS